MFVLDLFKPSQTNLLSGSLPRSKRATVCNMPSLSHILPYLLLALILIFPFPLSLAVKSASSWHIPAFRGPLDPFSSIDLQNHMSNEYLDISGTRTLSRMRYFSAHGLIRGPVTQKQFILFTRKLFQKAMGIYNNPRHFANNNMRPTTYAPRCAGLLLGSGENLEYSFLSETRPIDSFSPGAAGEQLYMDTHHAQVMAKYPSAWKEAGGATTAVTEKRLIAEKWHDAVREYRAGFASPRYQSPSSQEREQDRYQALTKDRGKFEAGMRTMSSIIQKTDHINAGVCAECRQMAQMADMGMRARLKGAWQVVYGVMPTRNRENWGAVPACVGFGDRFGCATLQRDNGIVDLYKTAVRVERSRHHPDAGVEKRSEDGREPQMSFELDI